MKKTLLVGCLLAASGSVIAQEWPTIQPEARPGARWWWLGSAVDAKNITYNLEEYAKAGLGASKKEVGSVSEAPIKEEYERCILCGQVTCIPVSMPIDWRENYEVGLGQVCAECAKKQREATERETLSHAKILRAVELSRKENNKK